MSTLLQFQAAAGIAAECLFGVVCAVGLFRAGQLTLTKIPK